MPQAVVDGFEMIEIDEQNGKLMLITGRFANLNFEMIKKHPPVIQTGEWIMFSQVFQLILNGKYRTNVGKNQYKINYILPGFANHINGFPSGKNMAIFFVITNIALPVAALNPYQLNKKMGAMLLFIKAIHTPPMFHFFIAIAR